MVPGVVVHEAWVVLVGAVVAVAVPGAGRADGAGGLAGAIGIGPVN